MKTLLTFALMGVFVLAASTALATVWNEVGDAGELPATAQVPAGTGPLDTILGTLLAGAPDADLYVIQVDDPTIFSATTCGVTTWDTALWLFELDGMGVSFNDDDPGGCGLQSTVTGAFMTGPGLYLLGITTYDYDALDASGNEIWMDSPYSAERAPDGPGAANPLAGWGGNAYNDGPYQIDLTGASFQGTTAALNSSWSTIKSIY